MVLTVRRLLAFPSISQEMQQVIMRNLDSIERLFSLLEDPSTSLGLQFEISWAMVNLFCLPEPQIAIFVERFQVLRTIVVCF